MKILITGAMGFIGKSLIMALEQEKHKLVISCRNQEQAQITYPGKQVIEMDYFKKQTVEAWKTHLQGIDVLINTVGIMGNIYSEQVQNAYMGSTEALFKACGELKVKRVIHFSALGTDQTASTSYYQMKQRIDDSLRSAGVDYTIIKPSLVYGAEGESSQFFQALAALPVQLMIGRGEQRIQPVYIDDITDLVLEILVLEVITADKLESGEIEALGPKDISFKEMLEHYRSWLGLAPAIVINLPDWCTKLMCKAGDLVRMKWLNTDNIAMLTKGNVGSPEKFANLLGRKPKGMSVALIKNTASKGSQIQARTHFLTPLLRITLGLMWIYTGLVSAFLYPEHLSYELLAGVGISGALAPLFLYGAAVVDGAIGFALLFRYKLSLLCSLQVVMIVVYTIIITIYLPEYWLHPFGPVSKNIPLLAAIMILQAMED